MTRNNGSSAVSRAEWRLVLWGCLQLEGSIGSQQTAAHEICSLEEKELETGCQLSLSTAHRCIWNVLTDRHISSLQTLEQETKYRAVCIFNTHALNMRSHQAPCQGLGYNGDRHLYRSLSTMVKPLRMDLAFRSFRPHRGDDIWLWPHLRRICESQLERGSEGKWEGNRGFPWIKGTRSEGGVGITTFRMLEQKLCVCVCVCVCACLRTHEHVCRCVRSSEIIQFSIKSQHSGAIL